MTAHLKNRLLSNLYKNLDDATAQHEDSFIFAHINAIDALEQFPGIFQSLDLMREKHADEVHIVRQLADVGAASIDWKQYQWHSNVKAVYVAVIAVLTHAIENEEDD